MRKLGDCPTLRIYILQIWPETLLSLSHSTSSNNDHPAILLQRDLPRPRLISSDDGTKMSDQLRGSLDKVRVLTIPSNGVKESLPELWCVPNVLSARAKN